MQIFRSGKKGNSGKKVEWGGVKKGSECAWVWKKQKKTREDCQE